MKASIIEINSATDVFIKGVILYDFMLSFDLNHWLSFIFSKPYLILGFLWGHSPKMGILT